MVSNGRKKDHFSEDNELLQKVSNDTPDQQRRKILKSAGALGTLYLAPTTVNLLLADRATAQSEPPIREIATKR